MAEDEGKQDECDFGWAVGRKPARYKAPKLKPRQRYDRLYGPALITGYFQVFTRSRRSHPKPIRQKRYTPQLSVLGPGRVTLLHARGTDDFFHKSGGLFHGLTYAWSKRCIGRALYHGSTSELVPRPTVMGLSPSRRTIHSVLWRVVPVWNASRFQT